MVNTCQLFITTIKLDILQVPTLYSPNPFASYKKNHGVIKAPKINLFNKPQGKTRIRPPKGFTWCKTQLGSFFKNNPMMPGEYTN